MFDVPGTVLDTGYTKKNPICVQTAFLKSNLGEIRGHMGGWELGLKMRAWLDENERRGLNRPRRQKRSG